MRVPSPANGPATYQRKPSGEQETRWKYSSELPLRIIQFVVTSCYIASHEEQGCHKTRQIEASAHYPGARHHNGRDSNPVRSRASGTIGFAGKGASSRSGRKGGGL